MTVSIMNYIKTFATYSDLFDAKYDKERLLNLIESIPLGGVLDVLSQMTSLNVDNKEVRNDFSEFLISLNSRYFEENIKDKMNQRALYSPQGLLAVWKWLLAYGKNERLTEEVNIQRGIMTVLHLCLIVSDYLYEEKGSNCDLTYEMFRNAAFNAKVDMGSVIARTYAIFIEIAKDKRLFEAKEYVDFNYDFKKKYDYTIEEYLAVIFGIFASFVNKNNEIKPGWRRPADNLFEQTALSKLSDEILKPLLMDLECASKWASETIDEPWNFFLFKTKPLFLLPDNHFLVVSPTIFFEQVYTGLFYKIRECYPKSDTNFLRFFGRPFELYTTTLIANSVKTSKIPYCLVPEFNYGKGNGKRSPDIMLVLDNKLLVVEVKSRRLRLDSLMGNNNEVIDHDINDMVIKPLKQAHDRIKEIIDLELKDEFKNVDEIYLMVVTLGDVPTLPPIERQIDDELSLYFKIPIKHRFHLDIEEFELLSELISRKHAKPIFKTLDNKATNYWQLSFKNFLLAASLHGRRPSGVRKKGSYFTKKIQKILFPKDTQDLPDFA